jgi:adenine-specific DNA-methyltransferase
VLFRSYYVKTSEFFQDYAWKTPSGVTVHFKLKSADEEQNNVKGNKRFFIPQVDGISWDMNTATLIIPFEYRPLTQQETITYGNKPQQDKIIDEALTTIPERLKDNMHALAALTEERSVDANGNSVSYLAHHLRQYTARNTRDFFIS